ncbi:hypothetical protein BASA50_001315 [Batrachochytrium salamandrivorans]|uniref:Elongation factor P C-terminal domain-containing protein n=1 Tax=Batrachochytrium salamandrivorans TaxID=1357716 RepID=A0ABQ8EYF5_9FUNG|nr:hypothetical protein BASA62_008239 [Batrachochytrium salamandrivorans]KAH6587309.1 hypothetical protein BASA50_001315 [Batrachochytrium salamandrivorans]KAH6597771.1 hypothetical protein BASA61_003035 [Batrachochytrium salamandrivorans]KAH9266150.1 hypothetical protein BASA84_001194 [Batrachochytrium salamandrivorans]KAH9276172.1 hypothetical protein BASA83_001446 [Batrachochytrium salamandrivorans]
MDSSHHRQARGGAHYKIELKELLTGSKAFERYNSGTLIEAVTLEQKVFQFLYADDRLHLIDPVTFEEHDFSFNIVAAGDKVLPFLQDPMEIKVEYHEDKPVIIKVPDRATYTVVETSPSSHSSSESGKGTVFKPAILDNGSTVNVPEFVAMGDQVVVDLSDQSYHSRVRESSS